MPPMTMRSGILALAVGAALGTVVAVVMTYLDWRLNPGGVFQDARGVQWHAVAETAASWFVPIAALSSGLALAILYWLGRRGC
jgi:hypothetical protein